MFGVTTAKEFREKAARDYAAFVADVANADLGINAIRKLTSEGRGLWVVVLTNFLCSRNRLSSPTAEQVFAAWAGFEAASAGLAPDSDQPCTDERKAVTLSASHPPTVNARAENPNPINTRSFQDPLEPAQG